MAVAVRGRRARAAPLGAAALLLVGCAERAPASPSLPVAEQRYTASITVLESPEHGPQLCAGVLESYPPQCGGPDVVGWDWAAVDGEESANGTTWGVFTVTGTWDGSRLTLTEPAGPAGDGSPGEEPDFSTPCEAPAGGWAPTDPATAGMADWEVATTYANAQADLGGLWLDSGAPLREGTPSGENDGVLNVSFTGNLEQHEAELRRLYGGPLCVSLAERSQRELESVQARVHDEVDGISSSGVDGRRGVVTITVTVAEEDLLAEVEETFPGGIVEVYGVLQPVD